MMIHPSVQIDGDVLIGATTRVWQFASLVRGARLGQRCNVASCAIVDGAILGDDCIVGHGASVHPGCRAGNGVFIGPGAVICNDMWPRAHKEGFDAQALFDPSRASVFLEDGCSIGANAVILPGVRIGAGAMIGAGAVVSREVPAGFLLNRFDHLTRIEFGDETRMRWAC